MIQKFTKRIIETAARADGVDITTIRAVIDLLEGRTITSRGPRPLLVNQREAARLLGVSRFMIRDLVGRGNLKPIKLAESCVRYPMVQLENLAGSA